MTNSKQTLSVSEYRSLVAKKPGKKRNTSGDSKITSASVKMYVENELGITLVSEHKFHPKRKWRFDLCCMENKIALEIEGGVWNDGRHNRGVGFINDIQKYNSATSMGWRVLRIATGGSLSELTGYIRKLL